MSITCLPCGHKLDDSQVLKALATKTLADVSGSFDQSDVPYRRPTTQSLGVVVDWLNTGPHALECSNCGKRGKWIPSRIGDNIIRGDRDSIDE